MAKPGTKRTHVSDITDSAAPFVFCDVVSCWGVASGIARITFEAERLVMTADGLANDFIITGHLRLGMPALRQLRNAIDEIEMMASPDPASRVN